MFDMIMDVLSLCIEQQLTLPYAPYRRHYCAVPEEMKWRGRLVNEVAQCNSPNATMDVLDSIINETIRGTTKVERISKKVHERHQKM